MIRTPEKKSTKREIFRSENLNFLDRSRCSLLFYHWTGGEGCAPEALWAEGGNRGRNEKKRARPLRMTVGKKRLTSRAGQKVTPRWSFRLSSTEQHSETWSKVYFLQPLRRAWKRPCGSGCRKGFQKIRLRKMDLCWTAVRNRKHYRTEIQI